ncbi:MAG: NAD(P)H-binding protein, partial [Myxococcales bacterium]|nr:NAD(P)H-binding protein [Myxococcales bacterium]
GVGDAVATAALAAGHTVRALVRDTTRVAPRPGLTLVEGDARVPADLQAAMEGSEVVLHALNLPYPDWDPGMIELTRAVLVAAERAGATVLFPGNVYNFGGDFSRPLTEDASRDCPSRKGAIRNRLEAMLDEAPVQTVVLRMGDFFGGIGESTWMYHLTSGTRTGGAIQYPAARDIPHAWTFLPDAAKTLVILAERRAELPAHASFNFAGHVVEGDRFVAAVRAALGDPDRRTKGFPWMWMHLARPFVPMVRELFEMRYLWEQPVRMDGGRLQAFLGDVPHTPYEQAVAEALA